MDLGDATHVRAGRLYRPSDADTRAWHGRASEQRRSLNRFTEIFGKVCRELLSDFTLSRALQPNVVDQPPDDVPTSRPSSATLGRYPTLRLVVVQLRLFVARTNDRCFCDCCFPTVLLYFVGNLDIYSFGICSVIYLFFGKPTVSKDILTSSV